MLDAGGRFGRSEFFRPSGRSPSPLDLRMRASWPRRRRLERRKCICQAFASNRVDARVWRSRNCLVTLLLQLLDDLGAD